MCLYDVDVFLTYRFKHIKLKITNYFVPLLPCRHTGAVSSEGCTSVAGGLSYTEISDNFPKTPVESSLSVNILVRVEAIDSSELKRA